MPTARHAGRGKLPGRFEQLVRLMPPQAIVDDVHCENTLRMINRLMAIPRLTRGQSAYLETLVQLVEAYESKHHPIETSDIRGVDSVKHLLAENDMTASDLARLLGVHPSMGSKILTGQRALTVDHIRKLSERFRVSPRLLMD